MGMAKVCGFLTTNVLLLILLIDSVALRKMSIDRIYRMHYCKLEIVIKGTYLDTWNKQRQINNFRISEVFRAPSNYMMEVIKINTAKCRYYPSDVNVKEFLIGATMKNGVIVCLESEPWNGTTRILKQVLKEISRTGC